MEWSKLKLQAKNGLHEKQAYLKSQAVNILNAWTIRLLQHYFVEKRIRLQDDEQHLKLRMDVYHPLRSKAIF